MSNSTTVRALYDDFGRGDIPAVLARFDGGIVWTVPPVGDWGGTIHGRDAVGAFFAQLPGRYGTIAVVPDEVLEAGDRVIVFGHHAIGGDRIPFAHIWRFSHASVVEFVEYVDNSALAKHVNAGSKA